MRSLAKRSEGVEADQKKMWSDIEKLQNALAIAETADPVAVAGALADEEFNRTIDPTVLRVNTQEPM